MLYAVIKEFPKLDPTFSNGLKYGPKNSKIIP